MPTVLSDMQVDRTRLADLKARLVDIEAHILNLQSFVSALRAERNLVEERLSSYKYPVLTLPNEIVSEIFLQFLPPDPIDSTPNGISSPTHLIHICRKWREIALATPALWRAIGLSDADIPFSRQDHWLEAWLSRSGACPLSIAINNRGSWILPETIAAAIVARRARLQQLGLYIHLSSLAKIAGPMPLLRRLDLSVPDHRSNTRVVAFRDAPLLRTVALRGFVASIVTLPWDQLTRLILSGVEPKHCVTILQQTTKLIECAVYFKKDHVALEDHLDVVLPCLQSLIVEMLAGGMVHGFLHSFVAPALRKLEVEEVFLEADPIQSLKSFMSKSQCKLQEVCITQQRKKKQYCYILAFPSIPTFSFSPYPS